MKNEPNFTEEANLRIKQLMKTILEVRFSDLDKDYKSCVELLDISKKVNDTYGIAFAYAYLGDCYIGKNESVNASTNLLQAKAICEKNRYLDLLPYVCTWLGLYYEMQNDRQIAMQYYLDALEFAERNQDMLRQSILLNNIASQFQNCNNYEVAKEYYLMAVQCYDQLEQYDVSDPHYAQLMANLVSVCCRMKQIEEAKYYYTLLEQSNQRAENHNQLYLCELLIASSEGNMNMAQESVDQLLVEMQKYPQDIHQLFETFLIVAESMVSLKEPEHARKMLLTLNDMCREKEYGHRLKIQYIWLQFYRSFGTKEEKYKAYEQFYELRKMSDDILNRNLSEGLLSKIKLRDSMKKNQEIVKEKEQLEDEIQLDELTQLFNRRSFRELTEQVVADTRIHTFSFIMIDVDYFKQYNDTYGHSKGDEALRAVADSLAFAADSNVYNFRYGGDEFVSLCKNKTLEEVEAYIKAVIKRLCDRHIPHETSLCSKQVTLSIGGSFRTRNGSDKFDADQILAEADAALYWTKGQGRNGYCMYSADMSQS